MKNIFLLFASCFFLTHACKEPQASFQNRSEVINVKTMNPRPVSYAAHVRATGFLTTRSEMKLSFKTGGIIESINVTEGQLVEEGRPLASLDLSEISAQVKQADISLEKAKRDFQRAENLFRDSVVTLETFQNAKSAYELAAAQKRIVDFNLKHSKIVAPGKGKVQKVLLEKNEIAAPGHPVILFGTTDNDWIIRLTVTDKDIVKLSLQDSATIEMDAFPGETFIASVSNLGSFADPVTGTYEVELLFKRIHPQFRTGFIAHAAIFPTDTISAMWVPLKSVVDIDGSQGYIYLVDSLTAKKSLVRLAGLKDQGILILEGIDQSDEIVTEGAAYLRDGAALIVLNE